ncbi:MAG: aldehyde-activating protein [Mesorhizobium amorphae]|nr:MAG: aldehyde-activating protein [Mesorhizobium amorphae]
MSGRGLPWKGGCRCGQIRFEVTEAPMLASACHCLGCQRMTASAFSLTLTIPAEGLKVLEGEPVIGGLHGSTSHWFCPWCMSWLWTRPEGIDWIVNLRPSMLDEHHDFEPFLEVWTSEALPWAKTPAVHSFAEEPPLDAYMEFIRAYAERGVA